MANEKRLIKPETIKLELCFIGCEPKHLAAVERCAIVDAVEVMRCKDCKHFVQGEPYDPCECMKWMVKWGVAYTTPDGYCHKAEVKDK